LPFADIHNAKIRYRESGRGVTGRPPALFIHGAGGSSTVWITTLHRVARVTRGVAFDLPGHGRSTGTAGSFDALLEAVGLTAATLCLGPSVLVGHSMGGLLAMAAAIAWPDKVAGLALVTTAPSFRVSRRLFAAIDEWHGWNDWLAETGHSPATPRELRRRSASLAGGADRDRTRADFEICQTRDVAAELDRIRCPTLVISGEDDWLVPKKWGDLLEERIPGARRVLLPRCGHVPMHEQPDLFGAALNDFLGAIST
jgi:pimeloyl-ACP methyl ester carboxylesterase